MSRPTKDPEEQHALEVDAEETAADEGGQKARGGPTESALRRFRRLAERTELGLAAGPATTQENELPMETDQWAQAHGSTLKASGEVTKLGAAAGATKPPIPQRPPDLGHDFSEAPTRPDRGSAAGDALSGSPYEPLLMDAPLATARTFGTLVPTHQNQPIVEFVERSVTSREPSFNPVFIWSTTPLGKTHLLEAAAVRAGRRERIVLTNATDMEAEFERAMRDKRRAELRRWLLASDLVLIDDVHGFEGTDRALQAFLASVTDGLVAADVPLILAAARPPATLGGLDLPLRARFGGGVVLELRPPDLAESRRILREFLGDQSADADAIEAIAQAAGPNLRHLRALANQLLAEAALWEVETIDHEVAEQVVEAWRKSAAAPPGS